MDSEQTDYLRDHLWTRQKESGRLYFIGKVSVERKLKGELFRPAPNREQM